ncbi:MAG: integration host factor subunit alpha [Magnetococcales bacterium]|nr:integration host factor subunit alpha [Magnetococcales bacterium]MBF0115023.1 integration host factor subunit alpha [Magnetococcales bacterium]
MTKADIVEAVYREIGVAKKEAASIVDTVFEAIRTKLENGESVKISRFGNFNIRNKVPRRGRNPKTGEEIEITARKVLTFKPSQILRERVRDGKPIGSV